MPTSFWPGRLTRALPVSELPTIFAVHLKVTGPANPFSFSRFGVAVPLTR
jgi:hypothetical protein